MAEGRQERARGYRARIDELESYRRERILALEIQSDIQAEVAELFGRIAYLEDTAEDSNPYSRELIEHHHWSIGWRAEHGGNDN